MTITLRLTKGSPLTHGELDGNFEDLDGRFPIQTASIGDDQITAGKLADNAVLTVAVADANITFAKIQDASGASKLLGRGDSGAGDFEEITIGAGLSMTGSTLSAAGAGLPTDDTNPLVQDPGDNTKRMRIDVGAVATATTRTLIMPDQDVDLTPTTGAFLSSGDGVVTNARIRDSAALSVVGRSANSSGGVADISAAAGSGAVLRESGSALGFGTIASAGIANDAVTTSKIANLAVTQEKLASASVGTAQLIDGNITAAKYATASIPTAALQDDSVTAAKLSHTGVAAGSYTSLNATIDAQGRITTATSGGSSTGLVLVDDPDTTVTVDNTLNGTHRQLTSDSPISVALDAVNNTKGSRTALEKAGAGDVSVSVDSGAGYLIPGVDLSDAPSTTGFGITGYLEALCIGYFGQSTNVTDAVWGTPAGEDVTITSAGGNLPVLVAGQRITVRNHSVSDNNGDYLVTGTPTTSAVDLTKESESAPQSAASEAVDIDHGCVYKIYGQDDLDDALDANIDVNNFDLVNIGDGCTFFNDAARSAFRVELKNPADIIVAASNEETALTTGAAKVTFYAPRNITIEGVFIGVTTAPTGANLIVDVHKNGSTIFDTLPEIQPGEFTSLTGVQAVLSTTAAVQGDKFTIDIGQIGSTVAGAGLKVHLLAREA